MEEYNFSDFILFADESGDHSLTKVDPVYPVFCLTICLFKKDDYINQITPAFQRLKFDFFGHDRINFHERDIRKQDKDFAFLRTSEQIRQQFFDRLNQFAEESPFYIVSAVIDKIKLQQKYVTPYNPYNIALRVCFEKVHQILIKKGQLGKQVHCIFENRGKNEDQELELEFYRLVNNVNSWGYKSLDFTKIDYKILFGGKGHNATGLQVADLTARPIANHVLHPNQINRSYEILKTKYYNGHNNKIFP